MATVGAPVDIIALLLDVNGDPVVGKTVRMSASDSTPAAEAVTNASGEATFEVTSDVPATVTYFMTELEQAVDSESTVTVTYTDSAEMWDYRFNGNYADNGAVGPDMAPNGGSIVGSSYVFDAQEGLMLPDVGLTNPGIYTIEMYFQLNHTPALGAVGSYKLIDFKGLTDDSGIYVIDGFLWIAFSQTGAFVFPVNTNVHVVLTRDGDGAMSVYADGVAVISDYDDEGDTTYEFDPGVMWFFQDEELAPNVEASGGTVHRIRIYDRALDAAEVLAAFGTITDES
jgi:hypothetical protein